MCDLSRIPAAIPVSQVRPLWSKMAGRSAPSRRTAQRLCDLATLATAAAFAVPVGEIVAQPAARRTVAFARQSAMYLSHVAFGLTYTEVGRAFGRDRTTAAHACRLVEDRRDDPRVDGVLGSLENACTKLRQRLSAPVQP